MQERLEAERQALIDKATGGDANPQCRMVNALGTAHPVFANGIIDQLRRASAASGNDDLSGLNFSLAALAGMGPKDHIEAMLCVQMVAIHSATMTLSRRLLRAETLIQQDSAERALNRLARTFAAQVPRRSRTTGAVARNGSPWNTSRSMKVRKPSSGISRARGWGPNRNASQPHETVRLRVGEALLGNLQADPCPLPGAGG